MNLQPLDYLFFVLIFAGVFVCGYKVGNYLGWREGYRIAKVLERQRAEGAWVRNHQDGNGPWDYSPKKKGATDFTPQPHDNKQKN